MRNILPADCETKTHVIKVVNESNWQACQRRLVNFADALAKDAGCIVLLDPRSSDVSFMNELRAQKGLRIWTTYLHRGEY